MAILGILGEPLYIIKIRIVKLSLDVVNHAQSRFSVQHFEIFH